MKIPDFSLGFQCFWAWFLINTPTTNSPNANYLERKKRNDLARGSKFLWKYSPTFPDISGLGIISWSNFIRRLKSKILVLSNAKETDRFRLRVCMGGLCFWSAKFRCRTHQEKFFRHATHALCTVFFKSLNPKGALVSLDHARISSKIEFSLEKIDFTGNWWGRGKINGPYRT